MSKTAMSYQPEKTILFSKEIRFHPELTSGEKIFLAEIQSMTKANGRHPFSCKDLGEIFGVSHQTIANWVKKLIKKGFVDITMDYANEDHKQFLVTKP